MIEKILNKYYMKKFLNEIDDIFVIYLLNHNYIRTKKGIIIKVKPFEYKEEYYREYDFIPYERSLFYFLNIEKYKDRFKEEIEEIKKMWR